MCRNFTELNNHLYTLALHPLLPRYLQSQRKENLIDGYFILGFLRHHELRLMLMLNANES